MGVATLFVGARFAVRVWRRTWSFWLSDICLMLTLLTFVAFACGDLANFIQGRTEFGTQYSASYAEVQFLFLSLPHKGTNRHVANDINSGYMLHRSCSMLFFTYLVLAC